MCIHRFLKLCETPSRGTNDEGTLVSETKLHVRFFPSSLSPLPGPPDPRSLHIARCEQSFVIASSITHAHGTLLFFVHTDRCEEILFLCSNCAKRAEHEKDEKVLGPLHLRVCLRGCLNSRVFLISGHKFTQHAFHLQHELTMCLL